MGPYELTKTHLNGTVTIQLLHDVIERVNIRRIDSYCEWHDSDTVLRYSVVLMHS